MSTLRCIAIDDEPLALELLEDNIRSIPFLELRGSYPNAMEAMQHLQREAVELVFSDIQMPGLNGLQLITTLQTKPFFILITAHEKFAVESFELDVVDYLLKPVAYDRFVKACNKALERYQLRQQAPNSSSEAKRFIFVPEDYKMVKVELEEVLRFEAEKDYVRIHFSSSKRSMLVRMSMKNLEEMLGRGMFLRIHKSHIVSIKGITAARKNSVFMGEEELPVGEQYRAAVQQLIGDV